MQDWDPGGRWQYIYRKPSSSIQFRGFQRDYNDLHIVNRYEVRKLPMQYVTETVTGASGVYNFSALADYAYRDSIRVQIEDEAYVVHTVKDDPTNTGTYTNEFVWKNEGTLPAAVGIYDYNGSIGTTINIATGSGWANMDFSTPAYPTTLTLEAMIRANTVDNWDEFIFTNQYNALGVFTKDVTSPSVWPTQFQDYMAAELALGAAEVHAKSTKLIDRLERRTLFFKNEAISNLVADSGNLSMADSMSSSEKARL